MNTLFGLRGVTSESCVRQTRTPKIEKLYGKRRKRYRLTYETVSEPCGYRHGDTFVVHPLVLQKLKEVASAPA